MPLDRTTKTLIDDVERLTTWQYDTSSLPPGASGTPVIVYSWAEEGKTISADHAQALAHTLLAANRTIEGLKERLYAVRRHLYGDQTDEQIRDLLQALGIDLEPEDGWYD